MKEDMRCELLDNQSSQKDIKKRPKKRNKRPEKQKITTTH